jgi:hypothetical protein
MRRWPEADLHVLHRPQQQQRIDESAQEHAECELIAGVAHKTAQQPRAHLAGRQGERGDGDREHRAGHADRTADIQQVARQPAEFRRRRSGSR